MRHFALSAIGRDRPGIVAEISGVLLDHEVNVEDSQMTLLRGHFLDRVDSLTTDVFRRKRYPRAP